MILDKLSTGINPPEEIVVKAILNASKRIAQTRKYGLNMKECCYNY